MSDAPATWVMHAWQHWHRPWAVTHAGWLDAEHASFAADAVHELALRLHYPAWCARYALAPTLQAFDDTPWWRLFSLPACRFEQAACRVGLALMYAAQPRLRLVRRSGANPADTAGVRWSLERARYVPEVMTLALSNAMLADTPMRYACLSLHWCLADAEPDLWARLKMRLNPDHLTVGLPALRCPDVGDCASLSALWTDAARATIKETPA